MRVYVDYVYQIIQKELEFFDAVYEDHIVELVGSTGLEALKEYKLLETCGVMGGRQLYTLVPTKQKEFNK